MGVHVKFTKTTHQIWSCQVALPSNSEIFYPNFVVNFGKSYQTWAKLAQEQKVTIKKQIGGGGGKHPPVLIELHGCCQTYVIHMCLIKIFWGAGVVTPSKSLPL